MGASARLRAQFWVEGVAAGLASVLLMLMLSLLGRTWIEAVVGGSDAGLDGGDGGLEWLVVAGFASLAAVAGLFARSEWHAWRWARRRAPLTV